VISSSSSGQFIVSVSYQYCWILQVPN